MAGNKPDLNPGRFLGNQIPRNGCYAVFPSIVDDYLLILSLLTIIFVTYCQDIYDILGSGDEILDSGDEKCQNLKI